MVLAYPRAQGRVHRGGERGDPDGPLEQRDVAQVPQCQSRQRRIRAGVREQQHGQVGPRRLARQALTQEVQCRLAGHGLLRQQQGARPHRQFRGKLLQVGTDAGADAGFCQYGVGQLGIPASGRQQQHAALPLGTGVHDPPAPPAGSCSTGTPVSTPRKWRKGSPTLMPPASSMYSRIVRSCWPPRFFITEMAWRTSPRVS